jgi:hypothetical protein
MLCGVGYKKQARNASCCRLQELIIFAVLLYMIEIRLVQLCLPGLLISLRQGRQGNPAQYSQHGLQKAAAR